MAINKMKIECRLEFAAGNDWALQNPMRIMNNKDALQRYLNILKYRLRKMKSLTKTTARDKPDFSL